MTIILPVRTRRVRRQRDSSVPADAPPPACDRVPRVARMLALAHHWRGLIRDGVVKDQAALSRLVGVSRARVTQVMDLLYLAPDIQEALLGLPPALSGGSALCERTLRAIAAEPLWRLQLGEWRTLAGAGPTLGPPSGAHTLAAPLCGRD